MTKEITTIPGYLLIGIFVVIFITAVYFWIKAADHMIKTLERIRPEKKIMLYIHPLGLLKSSYFTEEGNHHRKLLGAYTFRFLMACLAGGGTVYLAFLYG